MENEISNDLFETLVEKIAKLESELSDKESDLDTAN